MNILKKALALFAIIILSALIAGLYGILHDWITYSISNEYYTRFKFIQFDISPSIPTALAVSLVGFMATWWFGLLMGIILGLVSLQLKDATTMFKVCIKAMFIIMGIAFITGLIGLFYGYIFLAGQPPENFTGWFIPEGLEHFDRFICVGSMHNFSYLGGLFGLVAGIVYVTRQRKRLASEQNINSAV